MTVVVKDLMDRKGNAHPDVGSIIAYALSSVDYETKRLRDTETVSSQEHIELDFGDERAQYFVKVFFGFLA